MAAATIIVTMRHFTPLSLLAGATLVAASAAVAQPPVPLPAPLPTPLPAPAQGAVPQPAPTRGRLLYETHCIACHNSQMHWRDGRVVRDWPGLVTQVRNWQERVKLQWTDADILEVARHLNRTIYRLPQPGPA